MSSATVSDDVSDAWRARARFEYSTTDPDAAHDYLRRLATPHEPQVSGAADNFRFRVTSAALNGGHIQSLEHTMAVRSTFPVSERVTVAHLLSGNLDVVHDDHTVHFNRGDSHLYHANVEVDVAWDDIRVGLVRLDLDEIERVASEQCGADAAELRFLGTKPVSAEAERYWQATVRFVNREVLPNEFASASPLVQESIGRLLSVALLRVFPNTATSNDYNRTKQAGPVPPAALRRAVDFIHGHASEPISMSDIAAAARVTPRSLQHGFRRVWNTTPTAYLRQVRLERAHRELQAADPSRGDTVAAVAARWGFGNVGRFAARYRERYGHAPNEILRT